MRRLYIARDRDAAGDAVQAVLTQRAEVAGIEAITLSPRLGDFNEDLHVFSPDAFRAALRIQLVPQDVVRFLLSPTGVVVKRERLRSTSTSRPGPDLIGYIGSRPCTVTQ